MTLRAPEGQHGELSGAQPGQEPQLGLLAPSRQADCSPASECNGREAPQGRRCSPPLQAETTPETRRRLPCPPHLERPFPGGGAWPRPSQAARQKAGLVPGRGVASPLTSRAPGRGRGLPGRVWPRPSLAPRWEGGRACPAPRKRKWRRAEQLKVTFAGIRYLQRV